MTVFNTWFPTSKHSLPVLNVRGFGATGDGTTDDSTAIKAAITEAHATGTPGVQGNQSGCIVFFPAGTYNVGTTSIDNFNQGNSSIHIVGAGRHSTLIYGTVNGFIIDKPDGVDQQNLESVRSISIKNNHSTAGTGALRANACILFHAHDCLFSGMTGADAFYSTFGCTFSNCEFNCSQPNTPVGSVGLVTSQVVSTQNRIMGFDTGFRIGHIGSQIIGGSAEGCQTGIAVGFDPAGDVDPASGVYINGFQTERVNTAINWFAASGVISNCILTGTIGPAQPATATWAGDTATYTSTGRTLDSFDWTSGTRQIKLEGWTPSGYNAGGGAVTATRTGTTTFTVAISDPGGAGSGGTWSFLPQYGIRVRGVGPVSLINNIVSVQTEVAGVDLAHDGSTTAQDGKPNVCIGQGGGSGWIMPPSNTKSSWIFIGCDATNAILFTELPGQAGSSYQTTAREGMEYNITDGTNGLTWGDIATDSGTHTTHYKVRYNGTNWTVVGK